MDNLTAALWYAERGWPVFPLSPGSKYPLAGGRGCNDATTDAAQIEAWWRADGARNIGIATGARGGLAVVDLDIKDGGADGLASWAALTGVPRADVTPCVATPSGGRHLYLAHPGGKVTTRRGVLPGVDVRADGGYVVAPPSQVDGMPYEWRTKPNHALAPWHEFAPEPARPRTEGGSPHDLVGRARKYLDKLPDAVSGSGGHDQTWIAAQHLVRGFVLPEGDAWALLCEYNLRCSPPWNERELRHKLESARRDSKAAWGYLLTDARPPAAQAALGAPPAGDLWFFSDHEPQRTEWLIAKVLPREACVIVGAEEKTGKTWLTLGMALCLAAGRPLFNHPVPRQGTTLIVSPEGSRSGLVRRLHMLCAGMELDAAEVGRRLPIWPGRLDLRNEAHMARLREYVRQLRPDLLIIDPLITATGGTEENDAGGMQAVLNQVRDLREEHSTLSCVITHHLNKMHKERSAFHALRGSSALGAWADGLIVLQRDAKVERRCRMAIWHRDEMGPPASVWELKLDKYAPGAAPPMWLELVDEE